jgi:hypothetical protein
VRAMRVGAWSSAKPRQTSIHMEGGCIDFASHRISLRSSILGPERGDMSRFGKAHWHIRVGGVSILMQEQKAAKPAVTCRV